MFTKTFTDAGTFEALHAAQKWLTQNGYSYGSSCVMHSIPVMKGDFIIAKWKNLTKGEIKQLDGEVSGELREGPITVRLKVAPAA